MDQAVASPVAQAAPFLEHYPEKWGPPERVLIDKLPFVIGRAGDADHTVYSNKVSKKHAAVVRIGPRFAVRDVGSTNGTFVNGRRVSEALLNDGDIIHVAHKEFCFRCQCPIESSDSAGPEETLAAANRLPESFIRGARLLLEMIETEAVEILYQPIVDLADRRVVGFEALGRGAHPGLSRNPSVLLKLAEQCELAVPLSQLFRKAAVVYSGGLPKGTRLFLNVHPTELADESFLPSLEEIARLRRGDHPIVIEIAENAVADVAALGNIKKALDGFGFEFAYDDFGAGQARLLELTDLPPHYLKLDIGLVQGIELAKPRQDLVQALLRVVGKLGIQVIAEGIENGEVAAMCLKLGCRLGQGFLFGRPATAP